MSNLKTFRRNAPEGPVAAAVVQLAAGAGPGEGVSHAGAWDGVHEGRFAGTWTTEIDLFRSDQTDSLE